MVAPKKKKKKRALAQKKEKEVNYLKRLTKNN
jgi:hypothetical protein